MIGNISLYFSGRIMKSYFIFIKVMISLLLLLPERSTDNSILIYLKFLIILVVWYTALSYLNTREFIISL